MQIPVEVMQKPGYKPYTEPNEAKGRNYLPEPVGEEKAYILSVKEDAPFKDVSVMHFSFHKIIKSKDGKSDMCMVRSFADNQLEALKMVAGEKRIKKLASNEYVTALDMIEISDPLPPGDYAELMSEAGLRQVMIDYQNSEPKSEEELKAELERIQKQLADVRSSGQKQEEEVKKAEEQAIEDEDEEQAKKKPKKRRR